MSELDLAPDQLASFSSTLRDAKYGLAKAKMYQEETKGLNPKELISILREVDTPKAYALCGICHVKNEDIQSAFAMLRLAAQNQEYAKMEKDVADEAIYAEAMNYLAAIYREGFGVTSKDLNKAVETLTMAYQAIRDEDFKRHIQEELGHYKKKMFGGYKYVK